MVRFHWTFGLQLPYSFANLEVSCGSVGTGEKRHQMSFLLLSHASLATASQSSDWLTMRLRRHPHARKSIGKKSTWILALRSPPRLGQTRTTVAIGAPARSQAL